MDKNRRAKDRIVTGQKEEIKKNKGWLNSIEEEYVKESIRARRE